MKHAFVRLSAAVSISAVTVLGLSIAMPASAAVPSASSTNPIGASPTDWKDTLAGDPTRAFVEDVGEEFLRNQQKLGELTSWILDHPDYEERGYVASVNDATSLSTVLLWNGSDDLQTAALQKATELGIEASIQQRPQSLPEIDAASRELLKATPEFLERGFQLEAVSSVSVDSDALTLVGSFVDGAANSSRGSENLTATVADLAASLVDAPVEVEAVGDVANTNGTRQKPISPFFAGGLMVSNDPGKTTGSICSSGFGVNYGGTPRTTTARHCVPPSGSWRAPDNSSNYGTRLVTSSDGAMTILTGAGGNRTLDGAWNDSSGFSKNVYNAFDVGLNDAVCTSGGNSGIHCGLKITNMRVWYDDGYGSLAHIEATQQLSGKIAAAAGDSGGPVFVPYAPPFGGSVGAVGIIQAGATSLGEPVLQCGSIRFASDKCYRRVFFTSVNTVLNYGGLPNLSLLTGPQQ